MSSVGSMSSLDSKESLEDKTLDQSEMDIVQDHFSDTSITSVEDVQEAIMGVRRTILETEVSTQSRRDLVHKLIRLRIKLQDLEDKKYFQAPGELECRYHSFLPLSPSVRPSRGLYCDECGGSVWHLIQTIYQCKLCTHLAHAACLPRLRRKCVGAFLNKFEDEEGLLPEEPESVYNGQLLYSICPELSLVEQQYRCAECGAQFQHNQPPPRLCDYTGRSYCTACHWGGLSVTPARVVHNWDMTQRPVCQAALQYLHIVFKRPVIDILGLNPGLGVVVQELAAVAKQRQLVMEMKKYLVVCRLASEARLLRKLEERQHFVDDSDMYSLQDLVDVHNGTLALYLDNVLSVFRGHISSCVLCTAKGFLCELCPVKTDQKIIFPFDEGVTQCPQCEAVFHRDCFRAAAATGATSSGICPRCIRKRNRSS